MWRQVWTCQGLHHRHRDGVTGDHTLDVRADRLRIVGEFKLEGCQFRIRHDNGILILLFAGDKRCQSGNSRGAQKFSSFHNDKTINN